MFMASKYEEIYPPQLKDFVKITDNAYLAEDLIKMEFNIMDTFGFDLSMTSPLMYL